MNKKKTKTTKDMTSVVRLARRSKKQRIGFLVFTIIMGLGLVGSSMMWAFGPSDEEIKQGQNGGAAVTVSERIAQLEGQLKEDPQNTGLMGQLANMYRQNGEDEKAVETYLQALELKPGDARLGKDLALTYYLLGDYNKAITSLEQVLEQNASDAQAYYYLGQFYAYRSDGDRDTQKGIQALEEFVRLQKEGLDVQKAQQMIEELKSSQ